jgi:hypothetical protein
MINEDAPSCCLIDVDFVDSISTFSSILKILRSGCMDVTFFNIHLAAMAEVGAVICE